MEKYLLLDMDNLSLAKDINNRPLLFQTEADARIHASEGEYSCWKIIPVFLNKKRRLQRKRNQVDTILHNASNEDYLKIILQFLQLWEEMNGVVEQGIEEASEKTLDAIIEKYGDLV